MSIFAIISLSALVGLLVALLTLLVSDGDLIPIIYLIVGVAVLVGCTFIGIGINEDQERIFIAQYEAQKDTIESSLNSETLTGLERIELVKQASELNGECARRKAKYDIWHYVLYDKDLYDGVEPIKLE